MKIKQLLLTACLAASATSLSSAQENEDLLEKDFTLHLYSPGWVEASELESTIEGLFGRVLEFEDRAVENLTLLDESIVIYETQDRLKRILEAIETLDTSLEKKWDTDDQETTRVDLSSMVIRTYHPQYVDTIEFYTLAEELYSRQIRVDENWHANLRLTEDRGILIYEELDKADLLVERLTTLDESQKIESKKSLMVTEYQPRFVSPEGLFDGIQSFKSFIPESYQGTTTSIPNISFMRERGLLIIRDYPERAKKILETLERIDQPVPQTMMVCQVIQGSNRKPSDGEPMASAEIASQLTQILPYEYYTISGAGMLRANVTAGAKLELYMDDTYSATWQYRLRMRVGSYDAKQGALNLEDCELSKKNQSKGEQRPLFLTSTTIYQGEYAVIGVTGAEPLYLVVQLLPIQHR